MRDFNMQHVARKMNDLYEELVDVHGWGSEPALQQVRAFFSEGYTK